MSDSNDRAGGEGGGDPGAGRRERPVDWRVAFAELEGYVMASTADTRAYVAESRAAVAEFAKAAADRENRLVKWVVGAVAVGTTILGVLIGFLALLPRGG